MNKKIPIRITPEETIDIPVTKMLDPKEIETRIRVWAADYKEASWDQRLVINAEAEGYICNVKGIPPSERGHYLIMYTELKEQ